MFVVASLKNILAKDFLRIFSLLNHNLRIRSGVIFVLIFLQSLLELFFILSLTSMASAITNSVGLRSTFFYKVLFYFIPALDGWTADPRHLLVLAGVFVIICSVTKSIISYIASYQLALLGEDISLQISKEIMQRFLYKDYAWHLSPESSVMFQRMLWRPHLGSMLSNLLTLYSLILTIFVLFSTLVGQEPLLTTLTVSITILVGILFFRGMRKNIDNNAKIVAESSANETKALLCATKGVREVLIYRQQNIFLHALIDAILIGRKPRTFTSVSHTMPTWVLEAVGFIVVILSICMLVFFQNASVERISSALGLLVLTAWRVLPYCNRIVSIQVGIRGQRPLAMPVVELLESLRAQPSKSLIEPDPHFKFEKNISLHNVSFRYTNAQKNTLNNINITLKKGEKIGIIGTSGGGKSTLAGVLSGLLPCTTGYISVDNEELTPERSVALSTRIGYVPQYPFLFAGTLADNIAFSEWGKQWDVERIAKACKQASIDFALTHPKEYEQPIGENGAGLSGGQAQRVSIARAMYTDPSILIFDEATSALDQHNEKTIQETMESLAGNITCLIIAHRLTTVEKCDRIIWIEKGNIVMDGFTEDVLAKYIQHNN